MNQTTVGRVLTWLADATGKDVTCDRAKLVELMNDIRQLAYSNRQVLQHAKPAYLCVPVQCFCPVCDPGHCGCSGDGPPWPGISLPAWLLQPTIIFRQGQSMPYVTRWTSYEATPGQGFREFTFQDMGDTFVLERDPGCSEPFILSIMGTKCAGDQKVTVSFIDDQGKAVTESIPLKSGTWTSASRKVRSILPAGVRLPLDLHGPIRVRANGVDVAQWDPGIDVPAFRRVRITGACACGQGQTLAVKGLRRFTIPSWPMRSRIAPCCRPSATLRSREKSWPSCTRLPASVGAVWIPAPSPPLSRRRSNASPSNPKAKRSVSPTTRRRGTLALRKP